MRTDIKVSELMQTELKTASPSQTLFEVKQIFDHHIFHHLPVLEEGKLVGILSVSDFKKILLGTELAYGNSKDQQDKLLNKITVAKAMTRNLITISPDAAVGKAAEIFNQDSFHAIPVVSQDKLVGILSNLDLLNHFMKYDPR